MRAQNVNVVAHRQPAGEGVSKIRCQMTYKKKANDFEPHKENLVGNCPEC